MTTARSSDEPEQGEQPRADRRPRLAAALNGWPSTALPTTAVITPVSTALESDRQQRGERAARGRAAEAASSAAVSPSIERLGRVDVDERPEGGDAAAATLTSVVTSATTADMPSVGRG